MQVAITSKRRPISIYTVVATALLATCAIAQTPATITLKPFMGRKVTISAPKMQTGKPGPASVCVEGPPLRQCYSLEGQLRKNATVDVIQMDQTTTALFFSAESGDKSGKTLALSLLRPSGPNAKTLEDVFPRIRPSKQSQHAFWPEAALSDKLIFLVADAVTTPDDSHFGAQRFMISAYVARPKSLTDPRGDYSYVLLDRYTTFRRYDTGDDENVDDDDKTDILASESAEIFRRLKNVIDYETQLRRNLDAQ